MSRFPTLALVPPHAGRKLSEGPAGPRSTCGCVSALLPTPHPRRPHGLPQTTGAEGGRTLGRLVFSNKESALWFSTFLHRPLFGLPTALRALAPPGPASSPLLPSFLPTETHLEVSQRRGGLELIHMGAAVVSQACVRW